VASAASPRGVRRGGEELVLALALAFGRASDDLAFGTPGEAASSCLGVRRPAFASALLMEPQERRPHG
jgi:hypothetical protein